MTSAKILLMRKDGRTKYIFSHYWIPESKLDDSNDESAGAKYKDWARGGLLTICDGNDIDLALVADWTAELYKLYKIKPLAYGYDQRFSKDYLKRMDDYGFKCEMILQNKQTLSAPMKLCERELKARLVNYNENPIDAWCLGNAGVEVDNLMRCQVIKLKPEMRIDGAVTMIMLFEMLRRYRSEFMNTLR